jgi:ATP-dependent DNA ligase
MVINGEYMNKSKKDKYDQIFNHKFVIFDILVYNSDYLIGKTFKERINLINKLYNINNKSNDSEFLYKISDNIYFVKSYYENFKSLYNSIISIDMYEGLVLKRKNAKLEIVSSSSNNHKSQLKCRKPTKNYKY